MVGDRQRERPLPSSGRFQLRTLGELRLIGPAGELLSGRRKELVLLAYLARRSPRHVRRDELVGLLWGEREEARARQSLRQALLQLRRAVGEGLDVRPEAVRLDGGFVELDIRALEEDRIAGRPEQAVERWGGEFLTGADEVGGEAFRAWLEGEREAVRRQVTGAFQQIVEAHGAGGDWVEAAGWVERWVEAFPLDEVANRHRIEILSRSGRNDEALAVHAGFVARLRREFDAEPSSAFRRLATVLAESEARAAHPVLASPGSAALFTPDLVGRDAARGEITAAWGIVGAGGAATVVLEGAEGMGKTLLSEQFLHSLEGGEDAPLVLRARAREEERKLAWKCARDLLAALPEAPGLGGVPDATLIAVSSLAPSVRDRFPGLPAPPRRQRGLAATVREVLATIAEEVPVVVFVDDLLHADPESRNAVLWLAHDPPPGVLVLVTARPGWADPSGTLAELCQFPGIRRVKLAPLTVGEIEAVLGSMIEIPAPDRIALARRLHADTGGNPFYTSEIVGAMVDEGQIAPDAHGIWRPSPAGTGRSLPLPPTVRDAVGRRLGRLDDGARRVAAIAATLPEPSPRSRLQQEAGLPPDRFEGALDELIVRRLLRPTPGVDEAFEFTHPVTRRVARDRLASHHRSPIGSRPSRPRIAGVAMVAFGVVALLLAFGAMRRGEREPPGTPVIAVGQLVATAGSDTAGVADAVATMLATNLARLPELQVVSSLRMYELLAQLRTAAGSEATWSAAARQVGATELLEGELRRIERGWRLDLRRVDVGTGTVRAAHVVSGADAFELVDRATVEIGSAFGVSVPALHVAGVTTGSLTAYRFYEEGLRSYAVGDFPGALRLFETALAEDSSFVMAMHYTWLSRDALHQRITADARDRLLRLSERVGERERLLIRGTWGVDERERLATTATLATRYPTEPDGHLLLGNTLLGRGAFLEAVMHFERVVGMDSLGLRGDRARCRACAALSSVVQAYALADSFAAAERVAREWVRIQPGSARAWHALGSVLESRGHYDESLRARRTADQISPGQLYSSLHPAIVRIRAGQLADADRMLRDLARDGTPEVQVEALWFLSVGLRDQGRLREALEVTQQARRREVAGDFDSAARQHQAQVLFEMGRYGEAAFLFDSVAADALPSGSRPADARQRSWNLTHRASALAALGDTAALAPLADSIREWGLRSTYGRDPYLHHHVRGLLLAARGRRDLAAMAFRQATYSPSFGYTRTNLELARSLLAMNRPHEAVAVLQSALRGSLEASNLYVTRTELHELLGQAWEAALQPDSAAAHYRRALQAWESADPQFHPRRDWVAARLSVIESGEW